VWTVRSPLAKGGKASSASGYDAARQANPAKTFPGSDPSPPPDSLDIPLDPGPNAAKTFAGSTRRPRFAAGLYRTAITEKLDAG
jgi:hypothetical protein